MIYRKLFMVSFLVYFISSSGYCQKYSEQEIKLVYIYQFAKYFNWPDGVIKNSENFIIGFYGDYNFGDLPEKIYANKTFVGKSFQIRDIKNIDEAKECNLIFIIGVKKFETMQLIKGLNNTPVLTIGDQLEGFCENGGMVNFTDKTEKLRVELCPSNVENANLQVSSKLFPIVKIIDNDIDTF